MKHGTFYKINRIVIGVTLAVLFSSCEKEPTSPVESRAAGGLLLKGGGEVDYQYIVGAGGLPAKAISANGETVAMSGQGTLTIRPKFADQGGLYTITNASGSTVSTGFWFANRLVTFQSYGSADPTLPLPPGSEGGRASIRVHLSPIGDPSGGFDATLHVVCALGNPPPNAVEGIELSIQGPDDFNQKFSGNTLFTRQP